MAHTKFAPPHRFLVLHHHIHPHPSLEHMKVIVAVIFFLQKIAGIMHVRITLLCHYLHPQSCQIDKLVNSRNWPNWLLHLYWFLVFHKILIRIKDDIDITIHVSEASCFQKQLLLCYSFNLILSAFAIVCSLCKGSSLLHG